MADATSTLSRTSVSVLLAAVLGGGLVSCASDDYAPDGNIFLNRRAPRYGHGGTENPRYRYGANREDEAPEGRTRRNAESRDGDGREADEPRRRRSEERSESRRKESRDDEEGTRGRTPPERERDPAPEPERDRDTTSSSQPSSDPEPPKPKPKPTTEDLPYATPVPGSDGVVYSPYTNQKVDVKGLPPGSKARDPVSKKVFRVP